MQIRTIHSSDNLALAKIIRATLTEFGADHPGTVFYDATTDALSELFSVPRSLYFVAETSEGQIAGGGGIYPTNGLPDDTCELVKMYLLPEQRGKGLGRLIIEICPSEDCQTHLHLSHKVINLVKLYVVFDIINPASFNGMHDEFRGVGDLDFSEDILSVCIDGMVTYIPLRSNLFCGQSFGY
jgi:hypothetical protein